jgi:hypothetical protein
LRCIHFMNNVYSFFMKPNEKLMSSVNIHKMTPCQFLEFLEKFLVLLSLFSNKMASRSLNFSYKSIEFFVNVPNVGSSGP